jgi:hypothetical protein
MAGSSGRGDAPFTSNFFRAHRRRVRTYPLTKPVAWADKNNAQAAVFSDWMFGTGTVSTGDLKVWNGSAWVAKPVKVWNGSAWVVKPAKQWNGSAWVVTNY